MDKVILDRIIEEKKELFFKISGDIWEFAETRFQEFKSSELLCAALEKEGFSVSRGIAGMPTAFMASFGKGAPVIAILGEYDALSGMSQKSGSANKEAITTGDNGHGCGHNLLGVGSLAAIIAVKKFIEENDVQGTVRYYGCPAEEGGSGKAFMARSGVFDDVDAALTWHPFSHNAVLSTEFLANYQVYYKFHGKSAHAASSPHVGRSALDAVELMNVGVNYLREHIIPEARVHYAVTNTGGKSPNVVQAEAEVLYLMRAPKVDQVQEIYERICNIARGAALMSGTECEIVFEKACSNYIPNMTVEKLLYANLLDVGIQQYDEVERLFAKNIKATLSEEDINNDLNMAQQFMGGKRQEILDELKEKDLPDLILPYTHASALLPGSSDVGDVSWVVPTAQLAIACSVLGTPMHSWQMVAQGNTSIAHKGMITAGKVLARSVVDLLLAPNKVIEAKMELKKTLNGKKYVSPIPPEVEPNIN